MDKRSYFTEKSIVLDSPELHAQLSECSTPPSVCMADDTLNHSFQSIYLSSSCPTSPNVHMQVNDQVIETIRPSTAFNESPISSIENSQIFDANSDYMERSVSGDSILSFFDDDLVMQNDVFAILDELELSVQQ